MMFGKLLRKLTVMDQLFEGIGLSKSKAVETAKNKKLGPILEECIQHVFSDCRPVGHRWREARGRSCII